MTVVDDIVSVSTNDQISRVCPPSRCQVETANCRFVIAREAADHVKRAADVNDWGVRNEVTAAFIEDEL